MNLKILPTLILLLCGVAFASTFSGCNLIGLGAKVALIKLTFGCLPEGIYLDTPTGPAALQALQVGDTVIGYSGNPVCILQKHTYLEDEQQAKYLRIVWADGSEVSTSGRHRIGGVMARDIQVGDMIAGKVVAATHTFHGVGTSYDFLTEDAGYQINGIPVNSMIGEMQAAVGSL